MVEPLQPHLASTPTARRERTSRPPSIWTALAVADCPVPVLLLDPNGRILQVNREVERLYGWSADEIAGSPWTTLVPLEERQRAGELLERCLAGGLVRDVESAGWTRAGEALPVRTSLTLFRDEIGAPEGVACFLKDVRELKRVERELDESQAWFQLCQVDASFGTWDWDLETNVARCSDQYFRLYGLVPPETRTRTFEAWKRSLHPEDAERVLTNIHRALDGDGIYEDEFRIVWPDGSDHWLAARGKVLRASRRAPARMLGIDIDITALKKAERSSSESAARLRAILETAADGIVTIDRRGVIQEANRAASRMFGYGVGELIGQDVRRLLPSRGATPARRLGRTREILATRKDGSTFPAEVSVGRIAHLGLFTGIVRDISARREAEERAAALATALDKAEERERKKFAQFLHDDLQQLLVAAKIQVTLGKHEPTGEELVTAEAMLEEALDRTRSLSLELHPPVLQERGLGAALEWLAARMAKLHHVNVDFDIDARSASIHGETARLAFELVRELLFNVAKHSRAREARVTTTLTARRLELVVSDGGVGFDPEILGASGRRDSFGLSSVRERVGQANGELLLESRPGRGTRATVRLPLR